jgi:tetratricopeptide (TPR) repeat protein
LSRSGIAFLIVIAFGFGAFAAPRYDCPKNADGNKHGNLGTKYWENGQYQLAEKETREAIKYDPDCSMWYQNLGVILDSMGRPDEASQNWQKALQINKNWCTATRTESLFALGQYYNRKRAYGKSIKYFEDALVMAKTENVDKGTLGSIYLYYSYNYTEPKDLGNPYYNLKTAEELKEKALNLKPNDLFIKASLAKLLVLQNKTADANRTISEIISAQEKSQNPNPGVYSYLAHIYSLLKDPIKSAFYIEKAIDLDHGQAQYLLNELDKDFRDVSSSKEMKRIIAKAKELTKK